MHKRTAALFSCVKSAAVFGLFIEKSCHEFVHGVLVAEAGTFADAVHGEHGVAKVDGFDAAGCFGNRADGGAAAHVGAIDKGLQWQAAVGAERSDHGFTARRGGVAVAGSEFQHRTAAEAWAQDGVGLFAVVWMHGVGLVAAEDDAVGQ